MSFAVWITGLPASGKSTLARALRARLADAGVPAVHLESDVVRRIAAPEAGYGPGERDRFYETLNGLTALLVSQGFPVVVDATAPRRAHRERAHELLAEVVEVFVKTPLETCASRDPKGLYRRCREGLAPHLPGAAEAYEEPERPDAVVSGVEDPARAADQVLERLRARGLLSRPVPRPSS